MKQEAENKPSSRSKRVDEENVPLLFSQGVDAGVSLALRWVDNELKRFKETKDPDLNQVVATIHDQYRFVRQASFTRFVLLAKMRVRRESPGVGREIFREAKSK